MPHEHDNGRAGAPGPAHAAHAPALAPGKRTLTEALGAGDGLPHAQRSQFERSLGRDLSGVRVHTSDAAADQASRVGARAFASGQDIVFARAQYQAHDKKSQHLLAHEVAHTAQQQGAAPTGELTTTEPGDAAERDADAAASAMLAGRPAAVSSQPMAIARKTRDESVGEPPSDPEPAGSAGEPGAPPAGGADRATGTATQGDEAIGELSAERIGADPDEGEDVGPDVPVRDTEAGKQEIAGAAQQLPPAGGAEEVAAGTVAGAADPGAADVGEGGAGGEEVTAAVVSAQSDTREAIAQSGAESAAYKAEMTARRDRFEAEQHATMLEQLHAMSSIEKRQTLQEMGYDPKAVKKLKDAELDGLIEGRMESEQRKTKILGMDPDELAALSPAQKLQYLVDLGIDRGDLDKAGEAKATRLFDDIMKVAHVPGQHQVKIQIKGGLLGKSWVVKVACDAEGNSDIQAEKKGGFLSKLWGWVKIALPIILTVLAPLTAGASLIVLAVYQTATAIKTGDWLGAVIGAAGALVGVGAFMAAAKGAAAAATTFSRIADVATKVKKVAEAAQLAMQAAKAKNAGSLLGALASGAAVFAASAGQTADKFAQTMKRWSDRLDRWSKIISGGQRVVQGIQKGDPLAAIGGAFDAAAATVNAKNPTAKALSRASKITGYVNAGKRALDARPPNYAAVAEAALEIAGQLKEDRRFDDASRIIARADRLRQAWNKRDSDPAALADAALGLAEAVQLARYDIENDEDKDGDGKPVADAERKAITDRYQRAGSIVRSASAVLKAATTRPRPSYTAALDAATQLIAALTDSKQIDAAAVVTSRLDAWTRAVSSKDEKAIALAGFALGDAVNGLRTVIAEEHASARRDVETKLGPGQTLADDGGAQLPPGPTSTDVADAVASDAGSLDGATMRAPGEERLSGPHASDSDPVADVQGTSGSRTTASQATQSSGFDQFGQAASNASRNLICDLSSPIVVGSQPHYRLSMHGAELWSSDAELSYRWTVSARAGGNPIFQVETRTPEVRIPASTVGQYRVEVAVLDRGKPSAIRLSLDQDVVAEEPDLTRELSRPDAQDVETMRELVNDFRRYIVDSAAATGGHGITPRFLAAVLFIEVSNRPKPGRESELEDVDQTLRTLEQGGWNVPWASLNHSVGVGQIRQSTAAMVTGKTPSIDQDRNNRQAARDQIKANYDALPLETKRMILAQLQWPKSNIALAARLLSTLKNRPNRYPNMTSSQFAADQKAVGVVATEYNSGGTDSPASAAAPASYGQWAWDTMQDPLIQQFFPNN